MQQINELSDPGAVSRVRPVIHKVVYARTMEASPIAGGSPNEDPRYELRTGKARTHRGARPGQAAGNARDNSRCRPWMFRGLAGTGIRVPTKAGNLRDRNPRGEANHIPSIPGETRTSRRGKGSRKSQCQATNGDTLDKIFSKNDAGHGPNPSGATRFALKYTIRAGIPAKCAVDNTTCVFVQSKYPLRYIAFNTFKTCGMACAFTSADPVVK